MSKLKQWPKKPKVFYLLILAAGFLLFRLVSHGQVLVAGTWKLEVAGLPSPLTWQLEISQQGESLAVVATSSAG